MVETMEPCGCERSCAECGSLQGQPHSGGCDLVLYGEAPDGSPVTEEQCHAGGRLCPPETW